MNHHMMAPLVAIAAASLFLSSCASIEHLVYPSQAPNTIVMPSGGVPTSSGGPACVKPSLKTQPDGQATQQVTVAAVLKQSANPKWLAVYDQPVDTDVKWDADSAWARRDLGVAQIVADDVNQDVDQSSDVKAVLSLKVNGLDAPLLSIITYEVQPSDVVVTCTDHRVAKGTVLVLSDSLDTLIGCGPKAAKPSEAEEQAAQQRFCPKS